ncbi:MAG TPA: SLC13 family permease [Micromonosporaceae bacterium]|nr:SLC13 family permease [Micromonosporaceae bacterium]
MTTTVAVALLAAVLVFATLRPRRLPEAVAAVPAAALVVALGVVSGRQALDELGALGPTVGFLAAVLVLAHAADRAGVFRWAGAVAARVSRGSAQRLLAVVFLIASLTTAVLSLDATVVLLTPVVLLTAQTLRVRPRPHVYACTHLANSASLLLPIANLTNLLAFAASGVSFVKFAALMSLPWIVAIAIEYVIFRRFFAADLVRSDPESVADVRVTDADADVRLGPAPPAPRFALSVLVVTLIGFAALEPLGVAPAWVALAGALVLGVRDVAMTDPGERGRVAGRLIVASNPLFCAFVFALGIVVLAVRDTGLGHFVGELAPSTPTFVGLLGAAALAAILANLLNNLPATLLLVPVVAHSPGLVFAVLLGVNIGPNLTYVGSLATLLWREVLHARDHVPDIRTFLTLGAFTVPACLVATSGALWLTLRLTGTA